MPDERPRRSCWRLALGAGLLILAGCGGEPAPKGSEEAGGSGSGGSVTSSVGAGCIPSQETQPNFNGLLVSETTIDPGNPGCLGEKGAVCVAVGFQGRVSCPYGQSQDDLALPDDDPRRCRVPDSTGMPTAAAVTVTVRPQLVDRQAKDVVFCSCRCAGPDPVASYCQCPTGATCTELVPSLGLSPGSPVEGSYCVPAGIERQGDASGETCSPESTSCGAAAGNP